MQETNSIRQKHADTLIGWADRSLMALYAHARRNSRRLAHLTLALFPLITLLAGSCKTSQADLAYGGSGSPEQFRMAIFPAQDTHHAPAAGYVSRARDFITKQPEYLMMLTKQDVGYIFGEPARQRHDADANVWQYKAGACVVDFYFYDARDSGARPVSYIDVRTKEDLAPGSPIRARPVTAREKTGCLHSIVSRSFLGFSI